MKNKLAPKEPQGQTYEERKAYIAEIRAAHAAKYCVGEFAWMRDAIEPPRKTDAAIIRDFPETIRKAKDEAAEKAVAKVARPGGGVRGKQKSDIADVWRIPAALFAEAIWLDFPSLSVAKARKRIRNLLSEDEQPPSDRALTREIGPLKPQR
jgi:hypothetical protein